MSKIREITWREDRPFEVMHGDSDYVDVVDVNWSKAFDTLFWHTSGCMPYTGNGEGLDKLPAGISTFRQLQDHFHFKMEESEAVFCKICCDWYPDTDHCEHIAWNDEDGWWGGPGYGG
jgi:hypothetical protein